MLKIYLFLHLACYKEISGNIFHFYDTTELEHDHGAL